MDRRRRTVGLRFGTAGAVALLVALANTPARATLMIELGLEELTVGSDAVVHGVVERTGTQMATKGSGEPFSVARLRVREWLAGDGGPTVIVREPGAYWQGGGAVVVGAPSYRVGEEVVVFLAYDVGDFYRTYCMLQGKFVVQRPSGAKPTVERDLRGVSFMRWLSPSTPQAGTQARSQDVLGSRESATSRQTPATSPPATFEQGARTPSEPLELFLGRIRAIVGGTP